MYESGNSRDESVEFSYESKDVGTDGNGFYLIYQPGSTTERKLFALKIHTNVGITGEYVGGNSPGAAQINTFADDLIGTSLPPRAHPAYASTYAPTSAVGSTRRRRSPTSPVPRDGLPGLANPRLERQTGRATFGAKWRRFTVGNEMGLMLDPTCEPATFVDAQRQLLRTRDLPTALSEHPTAGLPRRLLRHARRVRSRGTEPASDGPDLNVEYDWDYIKANQTGSIHVYA